ncbi:hypothetical protein AAHE18_03G250400 [Arachis hypogaea]
MFSAFLFFWLVICIATSAFGETMIKATLLFARFHLYCIICIHFLAFCKALSELR